MIAHIATAPLSDMDKEIQRRSATKRNTNMLLRFQSAFYQLQAPFYSFLFLAQLDNAAPCYHQSRPPTQSRLDLALLSSFARGRSTNAEYFMSTGSAIAQRVNPP
jgi:hypothetical protein